jgi:hypothetical protein
VNVTGAESLAIGVGLGKLVQEPILVVLPEKLTVVELDVPEYTTVKVTVISELCKAVEGYDAEVIVKTPALAKLITKNAARIANKGTEIIFLFILCCNSIITLVYKYFYL